MNEAVFQNISPKKEDQPDKKSSTMNQRQFLKGLGAAAGVAITGKTGLEIAEKITTQKDEKLMTQKLKEVEERIRIKNEMTPEQGEIEKTDTSVVGETFEEQILTKDHITLDAGTKKAIYLAWRKKYNPDGVEHRASLLAGMERMRPWITEIRTAFEKYDIPEKYIYIGIAESHFLNNAVSGRGAVGPYQCVEGTARKLRPDIIITDDIDQRRDPVISAELCAQHLRDSYDRLGNWDLALMDYNGGFTNQYERERDAHEKETDITPRGIHTIESGDNLAKIAKKYNTSVTLLKRANNLHTSEQVRTLRINNSIIIPQEREEFIIENFNAFLEKNINQKIQDEMNGPDYVVTEGDTIGEIAQKFGISQEILRSVNNMQSGDNKIIIGQSLTLPGIQEDKKKHLMESALHHFKENINYPEKFHAICDVVEDFDLDKTFESTKKSYNVIKTKKINPATFEHEIQSRDTLSGIAKSIAAQLQKQYPQTILSSTIIVRLLMQQNNISKPESIRPRQKIQLEIPVQKPSTLIDIAAQQKLSPESLQTLNPAINSLNSPLPHSFPIRIPA